MATHRVRIRDIINQVLRCCGDYKGDEADYLAGKTWTRAQALLAINQALLEWARRTAFIRKIDTVTLSDETKTYTLPDDCIRPLRIAFYDNNSTSWISEPTTITERDLAFLDITGESSPYNHFLEYLAYNKIGWQPTVGTPGGDDLDAYMSYIRAHTIFEEDAWTLTDDDISFDEGTKEIRSAGSAIDTDAFPADATVTVSGTESNDGEFTVVSSTTSKIVVSEAVADEAAGADVTLTSSVTGLDYPEDGIPTWFHKDIKWGASKILMSESREPWRKVKKGYCEMKWNTVCNRMTTYKQQHGHDAGVFPT